MGRKLAHRESIGFGGQPLQRPDDHPVDGVAAKQHEHHGAAQPERQQRAQRLRQIGAGNQHRRQPHHGHCRRR